LSNNKVVKFRRRRNINIGIIIFIIILVYIAINVYIYLTKEHITIYEVQAGTNAIDNNLTGLILREEEVAYTNKAGYISYHQKDGSRVAKNAAIYSIDDNREIFDILKASDNSLDITDADIDEVKHEIRGFIKSFSNDNYTKVYSFKENIESTAIDIVSKSMMRYGQAIQDETGLSYAYQLVSTNKSGIVTYYIDSFEDVKPDHVTIDMFNQENYQRTSLRISDMVTAQSPVYKIITSELWSIVVPLTDELYEMIHDKDRISFTVLKDDFTITADLSFLKKGSDYFARLDMDKNMAKYINERYLDIELNIQKEEGLKIPKSAIVEKDFYLVPLEFFTEGGDSNNIGLSLGTFDDRTGEVSYIFVPTDIYYKDDTYAYVDARLFNPGDWIFSTQDDKRFEIRNKSSLLGVYNVNTGYAVFKRIEILYEGLDYYIVKKNTSNGLAQYDHIALDGSKAVEQAIIY